MHNLGHLARVLSTPSSSESYLSRWLDKLNKNNTTIHTLLYIHCSIYFVQSIGLFYENTTKVEFINILQ